MVKMLFDKGKMVNVLIGASVLMFCSLFIGNGKIAGTGLTLWVITVFWNVHLILNSNNMNFGTIISEIDKKYETSKNNKKRGEQLLYGVTIPMISIGLIMVMLILIIFFTVL